LVAAGYFLQWSPQTPRKFPLVEFDPIPERSPFADRRTADDVAPFRSQRANFLKNLLRGEIAFVRSMTNLAE